MLSNHQRLKVEFDGKEHDEFQWHHMRLCSNPEPEHKDIYGRQARKNRHITQAELAKALGMSRTTIGQIENGTVPEIGVRKLIRVLEFLELELRVRPAGRPPTLEELREEEIS